MYNQVFHVNDRIAAHIFHGIFLPNQKENLHLPFILSSKLQRIVWNILYVVNKIYRENKKENPKKFHQVLWTKWNKTAAECHAYAHTCCSAKLLSRIQARLNIPCSATADNLGLFLGACHREFQLEEHNEVSHHCGTELQERRQLFGEDMHHSRRDGEEHKERSSALRSTRLHWPLIFVRWHVMFLGSYNWST